MEIWLKGTSSKVKVPVLPPGFDVTSESNNTSVTVSALGEVTLQGKRKLKQISFSSFFPTHRESYCASGSLKAPSEYVKQIEALKNSGSIKLIITGVLNIRVTIESFTWSEKDGTGDIYYTLSFKEYRKLSIPKSGLVKESPGNPVQESARPEPAQEQTTTYTVKSGDCLSAIAKKLTGSSAWQTIYEQNKAVIGSNPNRIMPGMVLTIPGAKR